LLKHPVTGISPTIPRYKRFT